EPWDRQFILEYRIYNDLFLARRGADDAMLQRSVDRRKDRALHPLGCRAEAGSNARQRSEQVADHWHAMLAHRVELQGRAAISFGKAGGDLEFEIDGFGDGRQFAGV